MLFSSFSTFEEKNDWVQGADKDSIKVYTKRSETGKIRTSKAVMFVHEKPTKVLSTLLDFNSYNKWFPSCMSAEILKRVSDHEFVAKLVYKTPWPFPNLDCVERMVIDRRAGSDTTYIRVTSEPDFTGPTKGCTRVRQMQDTWQIVSQSGGVLLCNEYYTDMGGIVPSWLANTQAVEIPYSIFHNMRKFLKGEKM